MMYTLEEIKKEIENDLKEKTIDREAKIQSLQNRCETILKMQDIETGCR